MDVDYVELFTVVVAVIVAVACSSVSIRLGYRRAAQEAAGQIRQEFQIRISQIRADKRRITTGDT